MGSVIVLEDTLVLRRGDGFPSGGVGVGQRHAFAVGGRRLFNVAPSRVFLVEEIDGKRDHVGHALVTRQWVDTRCERTLGEYVVSLVYPTDYARMANLHEAPDGMGYGGADRGDHRPGRLGGPESPVG